MVLIRVDPFVFCFLVYFRSIRVVSLLVNFRVLLFSLRFASLHFAPFLSFRSIRFDSIRFGSFRFVLIRFVSLPLVLHNTSWIVDAASTAAGSPIGEGRHKPFPPAGPAEVNTQQ